MFDYSGEVVDKNIKQKMTKGRPLYSRQYREGRWKFSLDANEGRSI
jgi:hypothetical protein